MAERLLQVAAAIALAFFLVWAAWADGTAIRGVMETPDVRIVLQERPCDSKKVLSLIERHLQHKFKGGFAEWKSLGVVELCWAENEKTQRIGIIDEDGDVGISESAWFTRPGEKKQRLPIPQHPRRGTAV
jgi:hypothetical protein